MDPFAQAHWPEWAAYTPSDDVLLGLQQAPDYLASSMSYYEAQQQQMAQQHHMSRSTESKPRLSKEEVEVLEAEFQKNHKPNSSTKKELAESMAVDISRINNWFQNRRAREKKENNIRQYEARQKMEKERTDSDTEARPDIKRRRDLVASSAPFPIPGGSARALLQTPDSSDADRASETTEESPYNLSEGPTSSEISMTDMSSLAPPDDGVLGKLQLTDGGDDLSNVLTATQPFFDIGGSEPGFFFGKSTDLRTGTDLSHSATTLGTGFNITDFAFAGQSPTDHSSEVSPPTQSQPGSNRNLTSQSRSNLPTDLAARRNQRPPPLTINGSRSYSSIPSGLNAVQMKRFDHGRAIRRVASATGNTRIGKLQATPRSPFIDRGAELLQQLDHSPTLVGQKGDIAPPTPNTPLVVGYGNQSMAAGTLSYSQQQGLPSGLGRRGSIMGTPPATPGNSDGLFSLSSAYDIATSEDGNPTPGWNTFAGDFDYAAIAGAVPDYFQISNGQPSQSTSPPVISSMGPAYASSYHAGNTEYNWSGVSGSGGSSPNQVNPAVQFLNSAASNLNI